ncbi:acid protease [Gyrodon lividus]|nr:acid protease [Gyrodon lividus]
MVITALPFFIAAVPQPAKQGGTAIPLFKHSSLVSADNSVDVEALKSHVASTRAKILRGLDNFEKNTGTLHPLATNVQLSLSNSPHCGRSCDGHDRYAPDDSSTSVDLDRTFNIEYEDGDSVPGNLYNDTVLVAELRATEQIVGVASAYPAGMRFPAFLADGLMGMAFRDISTYDASPVFQTLISELYLGGTNPDMYTGDFTYTPVTVPGFWQVSVDLIVANGQILFTDVDSIVDTGTELIYGLPWDVATIYEIVGGTDASGTLGDGYYTFRCDEVPNISFTFGDTSFPIFPENLSTGTTFPGSEDCIGVIVGQDLAEGAWLIGGAFLRGVYTAFDVGDMRVGFATLP